MLRKDLPPRYYLAHFRDLIQNIRTHHGSFLEPQHQEFLRDFDALPEDAQCLYVRFVNRKGRYFFRESLRYAELPDIDGAIEELLSLGLLRRPVKNDIFGIFQGLSRDALLGHARLLNLPVKSSWTKARILTPLLEVNPDDFPLEALGNCVVQERLEELSYLLFLYFGETSENLSLYTLRDLGIWSENRRREFTPKFKDLGEARTLFFYADLRERIDLETYPLDEISHWPAPVGDEAVEKSQALLTELAETQRRLGNTKEALEVFRLVDSHPGRERRIRLLHQLGFHDDSLRELRSVIESPHCDEELLFAEDFLERKFGEKRKTLLTEILDAAEIFPIDEAWFRQPEEGLRNLLHEKGEEIHHAENAPWRTLFGILFWEEIFESPKNTFHSSFERLPEELSGRAFLEKHEAGLREKMKLLRSPEEFSQKISSLKEKTREEKNGLFSWAPETLLATEALVKSAPPESLEKILLHLAEDFHRHARGFPDLLRVTPEGVSFIEVKAPGDSLRSHQLLRMNLLREAGLKVEVKKITYKPSPGQTYVVVDLETTGGNLPYHRITEIGAVKLRDGEVVETFQTLVNPRRRISAEIQNLTGISNEMVKDAPLFEEVAQGFSDFTRGAIFVAHNVNFDYGFLQAEFERIGERFTRPHLCTKALARKHFPGLSSYGLKALTAHFEIPLVTHHRAMCDAEATAKLFLLINEKR